MRLCVRCSERPTARRSAICPDCHAALANDGRKWCNRCQTAVALADYGRDTICRACKLLERRSRLGVCLRCGTRPPQTNTTAICASCRAALAADGRKWCQAGQHAVAVTAYGAGPACRACTRAAYSRRSAERRDCATCGASIDGHARCQGCTRLYHGALPPPELCRLCARDRARGVPPQGYSWREVEVAA